MSEIKVTFESIATCTLCDKKINLKNTLQKCFGMIDPEVLKVMVNDSREPYLQIADEFLCLKCVFKIFVGMLSLEETREYSQKLEALYQENKYQRPLSDLELKRKNFVKSGVRKKILERDKYRCKNCNSWKKLHVDHIIPLSRGGTNEENNLQTLCQTCNLKKGCRVTS